MLWILREELELKSDALLRIKTASYVAFAIVFLTLLQ
jgi:hypothetical protein